MSRKNREIQVFSISFLDVLSCALGAIIILFVIIPKGDVEQMLQRNLMEARAELAALQSEGRPTVAELDSIRQALERETSARQNAEREMEQLATKNEEPTKTPAPSLFGLPLKANYAVFIIDVSGSMLWQTTNLYNTIASLLMSCEVDQFRLLFFDSDIYHSGSYWPYTWLSGTTNNKEIALNLANENIQNLVYTEPMGTNTNDAILTALNYGETKVIYLLTDGFPTVGQTNVNTILSSVRKANRRGVIINSIMVGLPGSTIDANGNVVFDPNAQPKALYDFLHDLAEDNGGVYIGR